MLTALMSLWAVVAVISCQKMLHSIAQMQLVTLRGTDGRDLTAEWQTMYENGVYVYDQAGFDA